MQTQNRGNHQHHLHEPVMNIKLRTSYIFRRIKSIQAIVSKIEGTCPTNFFWTSGIIYKKETLIPRTKYVFEKQCIFVVSLDMILINARQKIVYQTKHELKQHLSATKLICLPCEYILQLTRIIPLMLTSCLLCSLCYLRNVNLGKPILLHVLISICSIKLNVNNSNGM